MIAAALEASDFQLVKCGSKPQAERAVFQALFCPYLSDSCSAIAGNGNGPRSPLFSINGKKSLQEISCLAIKPAATVFCVFRGGMIGPVFFKLGNTLPMSLCGSGSLMHAITISRQKIPSFDLTSNRGITPKVYTSSKQEECQARLLV